MNERRYLINGKEFSAHDPALQHALARAYGTPIRPRCLCIDGGVEMYVSRFDEFVIKRMPESGDQHHPTCPSYRLPARDSGLGQVLGEAIIEHAPDAVELRLDFPLSRRIGRGRAVDATQTPTDVSAARKRLSLRGVVHYLWERAGFNRWYPRMQGKRSYAVVRKFLLQACEDIETKGLRLSERVFMPEPFVADHAAEIRIRHRQALAPLLSPEARGHFKLMIVIGELKEFKKTTVGCQLVLKHLPDSMLFFDGTTGERAKYVFERELIAWCNGRVRLIAACLVHARDDRCWHIDQVGLMMTSREWIPLAHVCEADVVAKLVAEERTFVKPLGYDAPDPGRFPNLLLLDAGARPVALDVVSAFMSERDRIAKLSGLEARNPRGWVWDTARDVAIPKLPPMRVG